MNAKLFHVTKNKIASIQQDHTNAFKKETVKNYSDLNSIASPLTACIWHRMLSVGR